MPALGMARMIDLAIVPAAVGLAPRTPAVPPKKNPPWALKLPVWPLKPSSTMMARTGTTTFNVVRTVFPCAHRLIAMKLTPAKTIISPMVIKNPSVETCPAFVVYMNPPQVVLDMYVTAAMASIGATAAACR